MSDGVDLHVMTVGPAEGPAIVLLHGFPEFWWGWRKQIDALAQAGFRVIVPDQRGYGGSSAPAGIKAYRLDRLVADVISVGGTRPFHLVGHDWGGIIAWTVAARHPDRVAAMSILNAPHLDVVGHVIRRRPRQLLRSAYVAFFQVTGIAEAALRARNFGLLKRLLFAVARTDSFPPGELEAYVAEWERPGRLTAMLNYYRALVRCHHAALGPISPPTQILWGMRDGALDFALAEASLAQCHAGKLERFPNASHFLQLDEPELVAKALIAFHRSIGG